MSNLPDMNVFIHALVKGELYQSPSTFEKMIEIEEASIYGLGICVYLHPQHGIFFGHSGDLVSYRNYGYRSFMYYFVKYDAVICCGFTSRLNPWDIESHFNLCYELLDTLFDE